MSIDHAHAEALAENAMRRAGMTPEDAGHFAMVLWSPTAVQDMLDDWQHYRDEYDRSIFASAGVPQSMFDFTRIHDCFSTLAKMTRVPCGIVVRHEDYSRLRDELSKIMPSEPGLLTPNIEVVVSNAAKPGELLLVYDLKLLRAIQEWNMPSEHAK